MKTEKIEDQKYERISVPYFEGYKCVGYKHPKKGEYYFCPFYPLKQAYYDFHDTPFLVYEKIPPRRYIFEETGEYRKVKTGEWYIYCDDYPTLWVCRQPSPFEGKILRKVNEGQH